MMIQPENRQAKGRQNNLVTRVLQMEERARQRTQKKNPPARSLAAHHFVRPPYLPGWPEFSRGTPNAWLRGALFAAVQGKHRRAFKRELLASVEGLKIYFTGWQLDQSDLDVWEAVIQLLHRQPLGTYLEFTAHAILKMLDRDTGNAQHKWLKDSIARLYSAGIEIRIGDRTYFGTLIKGSRDEDTGSYIIELDPQLLGMYEAGWTRINWDERQKLRRKPLALWLHGWYSTHAKAYPIKVETLWQLCGSNNKNVRDFRRKLRSALSDLKHVGAIIEWHIRDELVDVTRQPSPSQQRHLVKKAAQRKAKTRYASHALSTD